MSNDYKSLREIVDKSNRDSMENLLLEKHEFGGTVGRYPSRVGSDAGVPEWASRVRGDQKAFKKGGYVQNEKDRKDESRGMKKYERRKKKDERDEREGMEKFMEEHPLTIKEHVRETDRGRRKKGGRACRREGGAVFFSNDTYTPRVERAMGGAAKMRKHMMND